MVSLTYITASEMNETTSPDLRILVAGDIPMADFGPWRAARAGHDLAAEVLRARPDLLVMDAALATAELAAQLEADWLKDLRLVLVTGAEDADAAGLLIERPIELLDKPVSRERLRDAVDRSFARHVADAGGAYIDDRLTALRRDAERVASPAGADRQQCGGTGTPCDGGADPGAYQGAPPARALL